VGPGFEDFLGPREKIFFLMKYPVGCCPPQIEFSFTRASERHA